LPSHDIDHGMWIYQIYLSHPLHSLAVSLL
jgi:hypothetical protein